MQPSFDFYEVAGDFIKNFFGKSPRLHQQRFYKKQFKNLPQFTYYPVEGEVTEKLLVEHFYLTPIDKGFYTIGSIGVSANFEDGLRFVCIDLDDIEKINMCHSKLLPNLHSYGFSTMIEYGREIVDDQFTGQHIWIPLRGRHEETRLLFEQILEESELTFEQIDEIFGINKINEKIRLFLGPHLKRNNTRYPVEIENELISDPIEVMKHWLSLPPVLEDEIIKRIKDSFRKKKEIKIVDFKFKHKTKEFTFIDRNLELPFKCPDKVSKIASNCQAVNTLLFNIKNKGWIAKGGGLYHNTGLHIQRLGAYHDAKMSWRSSKESFAGRQWFRDLVRKYRPRDPETHQWESNQEQIMESPDKYFMSCEKWKDKFDMCEGCPFSGTIHSPTAFLYGTEIIQNKIGDVIRGIETLDSEGSEGDNIT